MVWRNPELSNAVVVNNVKRAWQLLSHGADPNAKIDDNGNTLLHYAKDAEMIRLLLKSGANVHTANKFGDTVLHASIANGISPTAVREIILERPPVNARNWRGNTPLHLAVRRSDIDLGIIKALMELGADINVKNYERRVYGNMFCTPLDYAFNNVPCAKILIKMTLIRHLERGYENVVDLTASQKCGAYDVLLPYLNACFSEIEQMKQSHVKNDLTLFKFMIPRFAVIESVYSSASELKIIANRIFAFVSSGNYPIYREIILAQMKKLRLKKSILLNLLSEVRVYVPDKCFYEKKVILDSYSACYIGKYLNEDDLLNLVIAYDCP